MLVLGREVGQQIVIGGNIVITITQAKRGWCQVGVEAPQEVTIHRREIQDRIDASERKGA